MKNPDLIQFVLLVVAMFLAYNALDNVPYLLWLLYQWISEGMNLADRFYNVSLTFLYLAFYTIGTLLLVKKSKLLAQKITDAASFTANVNIAASKHDILYVTLIAIGCFIFVNKFPKLLVKLYWYIWQSNRPMAVEGPNYTFRGESIPEFILTTVLAVILIVYAKTLTVYFTKHIEEDTEIVEIGTESNKN